MSSAVPLAPQVVLVPTRRFSVYAVRATERWMTTRLLHAAGTGESIDWGSERVRAAIEEDVAKARETRRRCCEQDSVRGFGSSESYRSALGDLCRESRFTFDPAAHPLRAAFLQCLGLGEHEHLEYLHALRPQLSADAGKRRDRDGKLELLSGLLDAGRRRRFHEAYDAFVRRCVLPLVSRRFAGEPLTHCYYQSFPCVRVVRPGEFSIGCHCDASYGFPQAAINCWLPLTAAAGTNSLTVESSPGAEDWHSLEGTLGDAWLFHGSLCLHFTPANTTAATRVSLDLRLVPGPLWEQHHDRFCCDAGPDPDPDPGSVAAAADPGSAYFTCARLSSGGEWERATEGGRLMEPDHRVGFPFV